MYYTEPTYSYTSCHIPKKTHIQTGWILNSDMWAYMSMSMSYVVSYIKDVIFEYHTVSNHEPYGSLKD